MLYAFYGQFWDKGPGSRKKADVVGWLAEKGEGHVEELKLHIIHELLEFCKKTSGNGVCSRLCFYIKDYMFLHVQIFNQTLCEMELGRDNKGFEI